MRSKIVLLLFPLTLAAEPCHVKGRVVDASGAAVRGAIVSISARDGQIRTLGESGADGRFLVPAACATEYFAQARAEGLDPSEAAAVRADDSVDLVLGVPRVATSLTVTASSTPQTEQQVAKALDVLDRDSLDRRGEFSLAEALRGTPGVRVLQLGGPGAFVQVLTRGMRAYDTAVLIDGFRFRDGAAVQGDAAGFLNDLMLVNSDRIEVLRGSGSSLYGSNAIGGAVNMVTDEGGGRTHGSVLAEGGGLGMFRGLANLAGGARDDRLHYSGGLMHLNVTRGIDGQDRYRNTGGQGFAQWSLSPRAALSGRMFGSSTYLDLNDLPSPAPNASLPATGTVIAVPGKTFFPNPNDPDYRREGYFVSGLAAFHHRPARGVSYKLGYQGLATHRDNLDGPLGTGFEPSGPNSSLFASRIDTIQARAEIEAGRFNLISGGWEHEREFFDNHARDASTNARITIHERSHTLYLQDQARFLHDRLHVAVSGRWQRFEMDRPEFLGGAPLYSTARIDSPPDAWTGDAALAYFLPRSSTKLRAHVGNGYRAPSLYERFAASFFGGSFFGFGEPRLRPERTIAFDTGIDQYLAANRVRLSGSFFYTRLQEVIGFGSFSYINTGGGLSRGVELAVEAKPARGFTLRSSYTYTNADERNSRLIGGTLRVIRVYDHMFTMSAFQTWKRWDFSLDFLAAGDYLSAYFVGSGSRPFLYPGPHKADLVGGYTLPAGDRKQVRFYGKVENLLNQEYFEDGFRTPKAWAVFGMRYIF